MPYRIDGGSYSTENFNDVQMDVFHGIEERHTQAQKLQNMKTNVLLCNYWITKNVLTFLHTQIGHKLWSKGSASCASSKLNTIWNLSDGFQIVISCVLSTSPLWDVKDLLRAHRNCMHAPRMILYTAMEHVQEVSEELKQHSKCLISSYI